MIGVALALLAVIGTADWRSGADTEFELAYLVPIAIGARMLKRGAATWIAVATAGTWLVVDRNTHPFVLHPAIETLHLIGQLIVFVLIGQLISKLRDRHQVEYRLARTDSLTGLSNRRAFWDEAEREMERCRRFARPFSLVYVDVDNFKSVNDQLGHRRGDEVLQALSSLLSRHVRRLDLVARVGGDEFALLLPGTDMAGASAVLEKLRAQLVQADWQSRHRVSCSMGCLTVLHPPDDVDTLVARADSLMYSVKRAGKGQFHQESHAWSSDSSADRRKTGTTASREPDVRSS